MHRVTTDKIDRDIAISAQFAKALLDFEKSETTSQQILAIIRDAKTQGQERYYQTLSNLTDILNNSQTEEQVIQNLKAHYPKIVK